jgi:hypothetical protein
MTTVFLVVSNVLHVLVNTNVLLVLKTEEKPLQIVHVHSDISIMVQPYVHNVVIIV